MMSASKLSRTFVLGPPDVEKFVTSDQQFSATTSPPSCTKEAASKKQIRRDGSRSSGGRGGGSEGRGGGHSGRNDDRSNLSNNNHRGKRSGGNIRKVSVYETLFNQHREVFDATGLSKGEIISRMKKGNVGTSKLEQFVSDLFQEGKKTQEKSWILVSKKSVKRMSTQWQQGTGIPGHLFALDAAKTAAAKKQSVTVTAATHTQAACKQTATKSAKESVKEQKENPSKGNCLRDESSHKTSADDDSFKEENGKGNEEKMKVSLIYFWREGKKNNFNK